MKIILIQKLKRLKETKGKKILKAKQDPKQKAEKKIRSRIKRKY